MSNRVLIIILILVLVFLYFVWAISGLALLLWFVVPVLSSAAIGLPWYAISKRRERQMLREMEEAARGEAARRE